MSVHIIEHLTLGRCCDVNDVISCVHLSSLWNNNLGDDSIESLILVIKQCPLERLW